MDFVRGIVSEGFCPGDSLRGILFRGIVSEGFCSGDSLRGILSGG